MHVREREVRDEEAPVLEFEVLLGKLQKNVMRARSQYRVGTLMTMAADLKSPKPRLRARISCKVPKSKDWNLCSFRGCVVLFAIPA